MKLNGKQMFDLITSSIRNSPNRWEYDGYRINNKELDVSIWVASGPSWIRVMNLDERSNFRSSKRKTHSYLKYSNHKLKMSLYQKLYIYWLYLSKIRKRTFIVPLFRYIGFLIFFPMALTTLTIHHGHKTLEKEEMEFDLSKSEYREVRLDNLLAQEE